MPFQAAKRKKSWTNAATVAALGVVFGDIGTSPLYALRECFGGEGGLSLVLPNILGVMSLIIWSLICVVTIKYLFYVMRADNSGEGGVLALLALVTKIPPKQGSQNERTRKFMQGGIIALGLFGAALLYGDSIITPAVSVLGALEGIVVGRPELQPFVIPAALLVLILFFLPQQNGTAQIGGWFGPIIIIWFVALAVLGVKGILLAPEVLKAFNPMYAVHVIQDQMKFGLHVMGAILLVVTGAEALFADMGHFGREPIRRGWFFVVLPSLFLNYFGQCAMLIAKPEAIENPFYYLVPGWAIVPMIILATMASVIASQAVVSGAFSLTRQAVQLGYLPRLAISHTSSEEIGQIYIGRVNWLLLIFCLWLVLEFRSAGELAGAYGVAVSTTMLVTTLLVGVVAARVWKWKLGLVVPLTILLLAVDCLYWLPSLGKFRDGGWFPITVGLVVFIAMRTWAKGRNLLRARMGERSMALPEFLKIVQTGKHLKCKGAAVYMTGSGTGVPNALIKNLTHNNVLHEKILFLTVHVQPVPHVGIDHRIRVQALSSGIWKVDVYYGFKDPTNIPYILKRCAEQGIEIDPQQVTYILGKETLLLGKKPGMAKWRERLFIFMSVTAQEATEFFRIPPEQVMEIGVQVEL